VRRGAPTAESTGQRLIRRLGIYALAPLLFLAAVPVSIHVLQKPDLGLAVHRLSVQAVAPDGPAAAAGLRRGDVVVAVDGRVLADMADWHSVHAGRYDLASRALTIERDGTRRTVTVTPTRPTRSRMVFGLSIWLAGLAFLMIGTWVHARRHDAVGRNFFWLCFIFAFFLCDVPDLPSPTYQQLKQIVREILQYLWPVYFLRFFLMFPAVGTVRRGGGGRLLFAPAVVLMALTVAARLVNAAEDSVAVAVLEAAALVHFLGFFLAGLVVFARKVLRRDRPILHTKLRVILLGMVLGVIPFLIAAAVGAGTLPRFPHWEYLGFSLLMVPMSFGLAIMRYGALDTAFVVRASLIYGLLTLLVLAGYFLGVGILGALLARFYAVDELPVLVAMIAACSLAVLPLRRRIQRWVDLAFYPARRANREATAALGRELARSVDAGAAHVLLLDRLADLYRPARVSLALADAGAEDLPLVEVGIRPPDARAGPPLPRDSVLVRYLDSLRRPVFAEEFEDAACGAEPCGDDDPPTPPDTQLLIPLVTGNRLFGILALGPKRSGDLYSQEDLANLANLAMQTAPVLRSLELVAADVRRRQLETELAVARDIQAQLLPTGELVGPNLRLMGRNEPCRQVGGDYYDYFPLAAGREIGFCIADVAGKGIPAALLMTTLRVTFRELAQTGAPPEEVIGALDARIGDVLSQGRFVCFFYGMLDPQTGLLRYCNAGIEPPLLRRHDGRQESLRRGGPVLGIGANVPYRRGTVRLQAGDLIVAFTDGITEQTSPDGAEFFEIERLQAMVAAAGDQSPDALCCEVFAQVTDFGGPAASDDRTVIVLQYR
jgi:sigma-B regulation protein RsbU (phosphoserine phosphatase)